MTRKTDEERLQEFDEKMEQIKAKKQLVQNRIKQKERKERTRRLIQVGAVFEKYFKIEGQEQAEQVAFGMKSYVAEEKESLLNIDLEKSKEKGKIVYKVGKETLIIPENKNTEYVSVPKNETADDYFENVIKKDNAAKTDPVPEETESGHVRRSWRNY